MSPTPRAGYTPDYILAQLDTVSLEALEVIENDLLVQLTTMIIGQGLEKFSILRYVERGIGTDWNSLNRALSPISSDKTDEFRLSSKQRSSR